MKKAVEKYFLPLEKMWSKQDFENPRWISLVAQLVKACFKFIDKYELASSLKEANLNQINYFYQISNFKKDQIEELCSRGVPRKIWLHISIGIEQESISFEKALDLLRKQKII